MLKMVSDRREQIAELCRRHEVRRLHVYGSVARPQPGETPNDIDLLVEFAPMPPSKHADCYFSLLENLESLLPLPIDLVELEPIQNPYLRAAIEATKLPLYEAA